MYPLHYPDSSSLDNVGSPLNENAVFLHLPHNMFHDGFTTSHKWVSKFPSLLPTCNWDLHFRELVKEHKNLWLNLEHWWHGGLVSFMGYFTFCPRSHCLYVYFNSRRNTSQAPPAFPQFMQQATSVNLLTFLFFSSNSPLTLMNSLANWTMHCWSCY